MALRAYALQNPFGGSHRSIYVTNAGLAAATFWCPPTSRAFVLAFSQLFALGMACWGLTSMLRPDGEPLTPKRHINEQKVSSTNQSDDVQTSSTARRNEDGEKVEVVDEDRVEKEVETGETSDELPPGLRNNGNLCFFNCVLQALSAAPPFVDHVVCHPAATSTYSTASVAAALKPVILMLETHSGRRRRMICSYDSAAPRNSIDSVGLGASTPPRILDGAVVGRRLLQAVNEASHEGSGSDALFSHRGLQAQQDAQELMQALVESLQREWTRSTAGADARGCGDGAASTHVYHGGAPSLAAVLDVESTAASLHQEPRPISISSLHRPSTAMRLVAPCPLMGWFGTAATCLGSCQRTRPVAQSAFTSVPLSLANTLHHHAVGSSSGVLLETLLESFTRREVMAGVDCEHCTSAARIEQLRATSSFLESSLQRLQSRGGKGTSANDNSESDEDEEADLSRELAATRRALKRLLTLPRRHSKRRVTDDSKASDSSENEEATDGPVVGDDEVRVKSHLSRRMLFTRLPSVLVFHVGRQTFNQNTGAAVKLRTAIDYPDTLDMRPFSAYGGGQWKAISDPTSEVHGEKYRSGDESTHFSSRSHATTTTAPETLSRTSSLLYDCCACVIHHGGNDGTTGHYTTIRRLDWGADTETKPRWAHASDAQVVEMPGTKGASEVNGQPTRYQEEAFLLIYSRRPTT